MPAHYHHPYLAHANHAGVERTLQQHFLLAMSEMLCDVVPSEVGIQKRSSRPETHAISYRICGNFNLYCCGYTCFLIFFRMAKVSKPPPLFAPNEESGKIEVEVKALRDTTSRHKIKEIKASDFDSLLDGYLKTFKPKRRGRAASPEQIQVQNHFDSIKKGVDNGVPFKELAVLLSQATGLQYTEGRIRSQWTVEARKRGVKAPPKVRMPSE